MRKLILSAALIAISLTGKLYAQNEIQSDYNKMMTRSKAEQTFNAWSGFIRIRDFVTLQEGRLILELSNVDDYENFKNLDSILADLKKDIAFYKDSLNANPTGSVRIDYVLNTDYPMKKMRFTRHEASGSSFLNREGEVSKLKFEQDTIRIIIQKSRPGISKHSNPCMVSYAVQATFVLGNYFDMDRIIADNILKSVIDTLQQKTGSKGHGGFGAKPLTIVYNPYYSGRGRFHKYPYLMNNEYGYFDHTVKSKFTFNPQFGAGVVRNIVAPVTDIAFQHNRYWNNSRERGFTRISGSGYYFFEKDAAGNFAVNDNWFVNASIGNISDRTDASWYGLESSFGIGYLVSKKGGYFKNNTFRVFTDIMLVRGLTIVPEIIFTDDFKQIFPGITVKVL